MPNNAFQLQGPYYDKNMGESMPLSYPESKRTFTDQDYSNTNPDDLNGKNPDDLNVKNKYIYCPVNLESSTQVCKNNAAFF